MSDRCKTTTTKIKTHFGSIFVHKELNDEGALLNVGFSVQGRYKDSTVGNLLDAISDELNGEGE